MRTLHRIGGMIAALLMLYLAGTGSLIQTLDLETLLSHAPPTDPTMQSIEEGLYGNGSYTVIALTDYNGAELPQGLDYQLAMGTVLYAMHKRHPGVSPSFVELRMVSGAPTGAVRIRNETVAFNAVTGAPVALPEVRTVQPAPPLREKIKELHRFWTNNDAPGVYFELLSGLILWTLLISGLAMYFKMLGARAKAGNKQYFWLSPGGLWRGLHRAVSIAASVFLLAIAFSGTWLGFESTYHNIDTRIAMAAKHETGITLANDDYSAPLTDNEVRQMTAATLAAFQKARPGTPIKVLRVRVYGKMKQGAVVTGGIETTQVVFNTEAGEVATLSSPLYPESGFPFGTQVHESMKHFHSGMMFGIPARLMNLLAGLSLMFLSVSGIVVYFDLWLKRRKAGRRGPVWL